MLTIREKKILLFAQRDLALERRPFAGIASELAITEQQVVATLARLKKRGYIRRFGAVLRHHAVGLKANCMCVWNVPASKIKTIAAAAVRDPRISHCYERTRPRQWPYNFYTMIHARTRAECRRVVETLARGSGVNDYAMLFTKKQFKKTSPQYIP